MFALRWVLIAGGWVCVALGVAGMFLPLLPTTPFLLLASVCFARGSERLHGWLWKHPWCRRYLAAYVTGEGMGRTEKFVTLSTLWIGILLAVFVAQPAWWLSALFVCVATGVTTYLLRLRTI